VCWFEFVWKRGRASEIYTYVCIYIYKSVHFHINIHISINMYIICIYIYIYIYIYVYLYTYLDWFILLSFFIYIAKNRNCPKLPLKTETVPQNSHQKYFPPNSGKGSYFLQKRFWETSGVSRSLYDLKYYLRMMIHYLRMMIIMIIM